MAVAVIGLVVWLGSTTPNQAAPGETTTTTEAFPSSTTTTQVAAPAQENPQPVVLKSMPWEEWAADLNANPGPQMAALEGTVLLTNATKNGNLQIIQVSDNGVQVDQPECAGEATFQLNGTLGDNLVLESAAATCLSPRPNLSNGTIIDGIARGSYLLPIDEDSGWFCTWPDESARLTRYSIDAGLGETYELSDCPLSVTSNAILMAAPRTGDDQHGAMSFYWTQPGITTEPATIVDDCQIAGFATDLLLCRTDALVEVVSLATGEALMPMPPELIPSDVFGSGTTSPNGRYLALELYGRPEGTSEQRPTVVVDVNSATTTNLEWITGDQTQLSWISDTQLAVLNEVTPGCADCPWVLTVIDVTDSSRLLFQLLLPESSSESMLRLER